MAMGAATQTIVQPGIIPSILPGSSGYYTTTTDDEALPQQPSTISPIFDPVHAWQPLLPYFNQLNGHFYGQPSGLDAEVQTPATPESFDKDTFLLPTETEDEYNRVTLLWYYMRGVHDDEDMLRNLHRVVDIMTHSVGWEMGLLSIIDGSLCDRIVASGAPLVCIPRRESLCSHTMTLKSGTVLWKLNMTEDWRFKHAPHVQHSGVRSYAGTQIRLSRPGAADITLGSLCVVSTKVEQSFSDEQKKLLVKAADIISNELILQTRARRLRERQRMTELLTNLQTSTDLHSVVDTIINDLSTRYPESIVKIVTERDGALDFSTRVPILRSHFMHDLWEDKETIHTAMLARPEDQINFGYPLRAVAGQLGKDHQYLVVATKQLNFVFDDIDTWCVNQCAQLINTTQQSLALNEALAVKDRFLRAVTHHLRTPIHGILGAVDLIDEQIKTGNILATPSTMVKDSDGLKDALSLIRRSGTDLMTTVNNILRLNYTTHNVPIVHETRYDLCSLENDVLYEVIANYSEEQLRGVSINFDLRPPANQCTIKMDGGLLRELIKCFIFNAISATPHGVIDVVLWVQSKDNALMIDITDTGSGIKDFDQDRIFQLFENLRPQNGTTGTGLYLATRMATRLGGSLSLVHSREGHGSRFRIKVPYVRENTDSTIEIPMPSRAIGIPSTYHIIQRSQNDLHLVTRLERHLLRQGLCKSDTAEGSLVIMNQPGPFETYSHDSIQALKEQHLILVVTSGANLEETRQCLADELSPHYVIPVTGPFYTSRLEATLKDIGRDFQAQTRLAHLQNGTVDQSLSAHLPVRERANSEVPLYCGATDQSSTPSSKPHALLVDDNAINLAVLKTYCKRRQLTHKAAVNGKEAIEAFSSHMLNPDTRINLVLMDLQMPECDGLEAVKRIRSIEKEHSLPPSIIFMITGQDSTNDKKDSFDAGVDDFYVKPMSMKILDRAIAKHFAPVHE